MTDKRQTLTTNCCLSYIVKNNWTSEKELLYCYLFKLLEACFVTKNIDATESDLFYLYAPKPSVSITDCLTDLVPCFR